MAAPAQKRFVKRYHPIYDTVARLDIDQEERETITAALTDALDGEPDFHRDLFRLLASDPLVACAGYDLHETGEHVACPDAVEIRIAMHLSTAPDGRSQAWRPRLPKGIRCVSCGAMQFMPGYQQNVLAREATSPVWKGTSP